MSTRILSGKPEPSIVTSDDPELPVLTPALNESLELFNVTDAFVNEALTFLGDTKSENAKITT